MTQHRQVSDVAIRATFVAVAYLATLFIGSAINADELNLERVATKNLANTIRLRDGIYSGGQPVGEAAFAELKSLGVRTIISVDGATPDVATAKRLGIRYVHLPNGYDGINSQRSRELAKAVRELPGPIYFHCHHGLHRSPAAAAVACIGAGLIDPSNANRILNFAGTGKQYTGLFAAARAAKPLDAKSLAELRIEFRETTPLPPLINAMVEIDELHDRLKKTLNAEDDTDVAKNRLRRNAASATAVLLREQYAELLRTNDRAASDPTFKQWLTAAEHATRELESSLQTRDGTDAAVFAIARSRLKPVSENCANCHRQHRDSPNASSPKFNSQR